MTKRTRIIKGTEPQPSAAAPRPVARLEDMDTHFVSLVTAGANRQNRFLVVKAMTCPKCGAVFKPAVDAPGTCPKCGEIMPPQAEPPEGDEYGEVEAASAGGCAGKGKKGKAMKAAVPGADATSEEKQAAQAARAKEYGIAALATGAALSYPANGPTKLDLYADPVNLKYPLAYDDNEADPARIRNAAARFAQNVGAYPDDASKGQVWGRIVAAELANDIAHSPNALDDMLPADIKAKLPTTKKSDPAAAPTGQSEGAPTPTAAAVTSDFTAFIKAALEQTEALLADTLVSTALAAVAPAAPVAKADDAAAPVGATPEAPALAPSAEGTRSAVEKSLADREAEVAALRAELAKSQEESRKLMAKAVTLRYTVGSTSALATGEVTRIAKKDADDRQQDRALWAGDLSRLASET